MLSDPIDLRIYLTDAEFRQRVLTSKAWAEFLQLPPIEPFDEPLTLAEIEKRNSIRANNHLPLLDAKRELAKLKKAYESRTFGDRFYELASNCITEIYGSLKPKDFNSLSAMRWLFTCKQHVIHELIRKQYGSGRRR